MGNPNEDILLGQCQGASLLSMRCGDTTPRLEQASARLWPQQLKLTTIPALDILICPDRRPRPGYALLQAESKAVLLAMAAKEWEEKNKGKPRPAWLPEPSSGSSSGEKPEDKKKGGDDDPPFVQFQLQFLPPGTAPQATVHLDPAHHGKPTVDASWGDISGAGLVGQVVFQFHKEGESGVEITIGTQANFNLKTNPGVTGLQGNAQAAYVRQVTDRLQIQGIVQAQIQTDLGSNSVANVSGGGQLQLKITDQVNLTAGIMAGPSRTLGTAPPLGGGRDRIDVTANLGVTVAIF